MKQPWGKSGVLIVVYFIQTEHLLTSATLMVIAERRILFAMGYVFSSTILILFGKILFNLSLLSMSNGCQLNHIVAAKTDYLKLHVAQEWLPFVLHTICSTSLLESQCTRVMSNLKPPQG